MITPALKKYIEASIASSTFRAYGPAVRSYVAYCYGAGRGAFPADVTPIGVAEWLAHLASTTALTSRTIGVYGSAVSSWCRRGTLSNAPAVGASTAVTLALRGIANTRRPAENAQRALDREAQAPLTPELLEQIVLATPDVSPLDIVTLTAAAVGVYGLLRPVELLGSHQHRSRALQLEAVTFFWDEAETRVAVLARSLDKAIAQTPHHFVLRLGATKADPLGANAPLPIAAQPAVQALWRWIHLRREFRPPGVNRFIFIDPHSYSCLSTAAMMAHLRELGRLAGVRNFAFTGRSLRRGGAASLMRRGAAIPDIQAAGRWSSAAMPALYAGADAVRRRQLAISKAMAPAPPGAGR